MDKGRSTIISVVGSGYVGLTTAIGLGGNGNKIICIDIDENRIDKINKGKAPFYEIGFDERLTYYVNGGGILKASTDFKEILKSDVTFVCVGTPSYDHGSIDLSSIKQSTMEIAKSLAQKESHHTVIIRSTVTPGTTEEVIIPIIEKFSGKKVGKEFTVAFSPEFLREGEALQNFMNPDKIIIGEYDRRAGDVAQKIFHNLPAPVIRTTIKTAEMIKYASNSFLATKISFINEIGNMCKIMGIDVYEVARAIGHDPRIGDKFLNAGIGFGGSCLPKDVLALINKGKEINYNSDLLRSVHNVNSRQTTKVVDIAKQKLGSLNKRIISVLGLTFKPNTNDTRQSPAFRIISQLLAEGAIVKVYDPMVEPTRSLPNAEDITFCANTSDAIAGSDCVILATEWDEFRDENLYAGKYVIDGRRVLNPEKAKRVCEYEGICW